MGKDIIIKITKSILFNKERFKPMQNNQSEKINVLNRIYSANISPKEFINPENKQIISYHVLELGLNLNGSDQILELKLSNKSNAKLLILSSTPKPENFLEDNENM